MKPLAPNTLLQNRYLVVHLIGKGGMGEVYLAVDQRLGSAVALKRTFYAGEEQLGNAFEREARTLARVRHAVLPKVSDHFIENENQFLVMEHISGDDLAKRLIATQKPFPLSWVLFWADQLLDALAYLHSHEPPIIHRDIKPQNLKLTDENNIVLLDFGLSKNSVTQPRDSGGNSSESSSVVGYTPHYAPMEQIRGTGTSPRSDIYSLSATLYQLLTNIVPPDALTRADQVLGGKPDPIQPIWQINAEIPRAISEVILKGMSISQEHRYPTAREMQKILREVYAHLQSAMAEKTVALGAHEVGVAPEMKPLPPSQEKTEYYSGASSPGNPLPADTNVGAETIPFGLNDNSDFNSSEPQDVQKTEQIQDFDATIRLDSKPQVAAEQQIPSTPSSSASPTEVFPPADSKPKQSAIKTELYIPNEYADEYLKDDAAASPQNLAAESYGGNEEGFSPRENLTAEKTTPFVAFEDRPGEPFLDKTQAVSNFNSFPPRENPASPYDTQISANDYSSQPRPNQFDQQQFDSAPISARGKTDRQTSGKKKSKGLVLGVIGGLFGLLILAAGALGVGWYLTREPAGPDISNVSTPSPEPSLTPTPEPTPEPTPDQSNTNNANNESNVNAANTENSVTPTITPPSKQTTQPVQQKPVTSQRKTPVIKENQPTAKPKAPEPKKTRRSDVIPQ